MDWFQSAAGNIFPLSVEKRDFSRALLEWEYRGNTYDLEVPEEVCQLCGHQDIRFQFEIVNRNNQNALLVGSECIKKFDGISVLDEQGNALPLREASKKINRDRQKLVTDAQIRGMLYALIELAKKDDMFDLVSFEKFFEERGAYTPKQLAALIWRFDKHGIPFNPSCFKIYIRRQKDKDALLTLEEFRLKKMWPCLSLAQREYVRHRRHISF